MSKELPHLLIQQARLLQGQKLTSARAQDLATVVGPLNDTVADAIQDHPYDVDATQFYAVLDHYADHDDDPANDPDAESGS